MNRNFLKQHFRCNFKDNLNSCMIIELDLNISFSIKLANKSIKIKDKDYSEIGVSNILPTMSMNLRVANI